MTFEIKGVKIEFSFSFFTVSALMLLLSNGKIALMCFLSSVLHELGHLSLMLLFSQKISAVTFGAFGVRIDRTGAGLQSYKKQALIALGGVFVNFALCAFSMLIYAASKKEEAAILFFINLFLALLNLMPADGLDAWNALDCLLTLRLGEEKAKKVLSVVSATTVLLFTLFCAVYFFRFGLNVSLAAACVYLIFLKFK